MTYLFELLKKNVSRKIKFDFDFIEFISSFFIPLRKMATRRVYMQYADIIQYRMATTYLKNSSRKFPMNHPNRPEWEVPAT